MTAWVKTGKAQNQQKISALPPISDRTADIVDRQLRAIRRHSTALRPEEQGSLISSCALTCPLARATGNRTRDLSGTFNEKSRGG